MLEQLDDAESGADARAAGTLLTVLFWGFLSVLTDRLGLDYGSRSGTFALREHHAWLPPYGLPSMFFLLGGLK